MSRPLYAYVLAIVGVFAAVGAGLGLAANFTLGFFIEQFVDPGTNPLDVTQVAILFLVTILFLYTLGPIVSSAAGIGVGLALPDRRSAAAIVAGIGSFVGFYLFVGLGLFLTFTVLAEYGAPLGGGEVEADGGGNGGGGGGDGGPLDPSALVGLMVQVSLPVALVGMASAYLASRIAGPIGGSRARTPPLDADDGSPASERVPDEDHPDAVESVESSGRSDADVASSTDE